MVQNKTIRVDKDHPDPDIINQAAGILKTGGLIIFPAACLYGVAANALSADAVEKVFQLKQRPRKNPILVLIKNTDQLDGLVKTIPDKARILMNQFWPGGLTLIFDVTDSINPKLTAGCRKLGIRLPGHPVAKALVNSVDFPVTGTSANLSGRPGCTKTDMLCPEIIEKVDLVLDAGPVKGGAGSTVVDITCTPPRILRQGATPAKDIYACLKN
ncbi:threonylcarbamoyl-AMP synthase [Desulfobacter hydrogenophilus]|uniref:L-threonylcarbamoyladenylate synthase n=1 Tax=Desulfobacter hydrogenophilus TaxID=2291 RepID=A0A328F8S9_9BACT|nr:L-threonylcarbamoyladenylate synthase [Desulfobacter hydrogenophilus]NDY73300.1 threonylcarbamoyl-AMP synthase [Desulfobacter hydrogenophilus]QBH15283.1 threonylcarbamoyl-AMP synthase [Desulfobacter hydrogenophilus]RAM00626.1 threonylcarbamoyl-AMP synthase [Desulfobacter hydrogenophilus]